ncbi:monoacylglycerol lipase [soil metagenome]
MDTSRVTIISGGGDEILRTTFRGGGGERPRFGVALFHGLGDHTGTYGEVAQAMVAAGGYVVGTDWPGNGGSSGPRGHLAGVGTAVGIIAETVAAVREDIPAGAPIILAAHSTGAFLVVQYLTQGGGDGIHSVWLNGALVEPAAGQPWVKQMVALGLGRVLPQVTLPTGIERDLCRRLEDDPPGMHGRVSLGFGAALIRARRGLFGRLGAIEPGIRLLMTHGGEDRVCLPESARRLFEAMPMREKRFELLPGLYHETFRDVGKEALFAVLRPWFA